MGVPSTQFCEILSPPLITGWRRRAGDLRPRHPRLRELTFDSRDLSLSGSEPCPTSDKLGRWSYTFRARAAPSVKLMSNQSSRRSTNPNERSHFSGGKTSYLTHIQGAVRGQRSCGPFVLRFIGKTRPYHAYCMCSFRTILLHRSSCRFVRRIILFGIIYQHYISRETHSRHCPSTFPSNLRESCCLASRFRWIFSPKVRPVVQHIIGEN